MKTSLWGVIALVTGIVGFLLGYSVSAYSGNRAAQLVRAGHGSPAPAAAAPAPAAHAAKAEAGGYPATATPPPAKAEAGGAPTPAKPAPPKAEGTGSKTAAAGY